MFGLTSTTAPKQTGMTRGVWGDAVEDGVVALAWSSDGGSVAAMGATRDTVVFRAEDGVKVASIPEHRRGNLALAWHPKTDLLATSGQDGTARLVSGSSGALRQELSACEDWVGCLAWSPDGEVLATGAGRTLRFWNSEGRQLVDCDKHTSTIADLKWRPGTRLLASAAYGGVCFWTGDKPRAKHAYEFQGSMLALAWSPTGKFLASGNQDSTAIFWEYDSPDEPAAMTGFPAKIQHLSWDHSGRFLITTSGSMACVWDFHGPRGPRGSRPIVLKLHDKPITGAAFQHRGGFFATASEDGGLAIWKLGRKEAVVTGAFEFRQPVAAIAWSPDDRSIACGCDNGVVAVLGID